MTSCAHIPPGASFVPINYRIAQVFPNHDVRLTLQEHFLTLTTLAGGGCGTDQVNIPIDEFARFVALSLAHPMVRNHPDILNNPDLQDAIAPLLVEHLAPGLSGRRTQFIVQDDVVVEGENEALEAERVEEARLDELRLEREIAVIDTPEQEF